MMKIITQENREGKDKKKGVSGMKKLMFSAVIAIMSLTMVGNAFAMLDHDSCKYISQKGNGQELDYVSEGGVK